MAKKDETQKCIKCNEVKDLNKDFYVSYSCLHATGRVPICKSCISKYDFHNMTEVCEVLRILDKPFKKDIYDTALLKGGDNPLGKYIRILSLNNRTETWKDSDGIVDEVKTITRMNTEIFRKQKELEELEEKTKSVKKEEVAKIPDELIKKWGVGYPKEMYEALEDKFRLIEQSYPIRSSMHLESLKNYCLFQYRSEEAIRNNDPDTSQKWSRLAQEQAKQAKITPQQLSQQDLTQGLDSFSSLVVAVEKAVSIIPIMPQFIAKPKDKVDFTVLCYVNYERELKGLPRVEHADIYDFYNKMVEDYINSSPSDYAFLKDVDNSLPPIDRLYHYVFDIAIPKAKKENPYDPFYQNLEKWVEVVSYLRWFPDLFFDLITPKDKNGNPQGIRLDLDQRVLLRCMARFKRMYVVFPRGYAKTFLQTLSAFHTAIFYPNIELALSAQTKQNASALIKDKYGEIMKFFPMLENETIEKKNRFADNLSEVYWKSGSKIDTLANAQSSKGQRRKRMVIEESALLDNKLFEDALEPIVNVPRRSVGALTCVIPYELNGQINFFTTSYFKGTTEYARNVSMSEEMLALNGTMILGSDFELACSYGRGEPRSVILDKKEKLSPTMFAVNYLSKWVGASDSQLIAINKVMDLRVVTKADLKWDKKHEYIIACDVARSEHKENNQSSIVVLKLIKNKKGKLVNVICVNIINFPSTINFQTLAINLMKIKMIYNAKAVVVDANGLGVGLVDELLKEQFDPDTKESLGCWDTMNTDQEPEIDYSEECLYALKSQQINHDIIVNFTNYIESGKLQLLEKRQDAGYDINDDEYIRTEVLPFAQTDLLLEEIANLRLVQTDRNNKLSVERVARKVDKDRYSALAYGLYYIKLFEENDFIMESDEDASDYCLVN